MSLSPDLKLAAMDKSLPESARKLHQTLRNAGFACFVVGGWVRNILIASEFDQNQLTRNKNWGDIDFTTAATPEQVVSLFPKTYPTGISHGTVTVVFQEDTFEVTTFRSEGKYLDNRRPQNVNFAKTIEEDLVRRDFTINAFAYEPMDNKLIDLFNGMDDLRDRILRVITLGHESSAARFQEDALRMMRACRLAARFGFTIEAETLTAISSSARLITAISQERIRDELIKTVTAPKARIGLEYLRSTGITPLILPELAATVGVTQNRFHAYDVYYHSLEVLSSLNHLQSQLGRIDYRLSMAGLFHDIAKPQTRSTTPEKLIEGAPHVNFHRHEIIGAEMVKAIMKRLKFSVKDINSVSHLVRHHMFYYTSEWKDGTVRRFVSRIGRENLPALFLLRQADRLGKGNIEPEYQEDNRDLEELQKRIKELVTNESALTLADLAIDGKILMETFSLSAGPILGYLLAELLELVLDDPSQNCREKLLSSAKTILDRGIPQKYIRDRKRPAY